MRERSEFQEALVAVSGLPTTSVYFQPASNIQLSYPCIIYKRGKRKKVFADNLSYSNHTVWTVTIIDPDADSNIPSLIDEMQHASYDRQYTVEGLWHSVFTIIF